MWHYKAIHSHPSSTNQPVERSQESPQTDLCSLGKCIRMIAWVAVRWIGGGVVRLVDVVDVVHVVQSGHHALFCVALPYCTDI